MGIDPHNSMGWGCSHQENAYSWIFKELSWCCKGTVMALARLTFEGENVMSWTEHRGFLTCYSCVYLFFKIRKRLILSDKGQLDWKKMYFKLIRCYPRKEQYGDTLQLCRHCHILSWKVWGARGTDLPGAGASASSDCSWLRVLQLVCLHSLVNSYILILPQLLRPFLLCASEIPSLSWTWVVSIGARGLEHGHVLGLPARNHFSTASSFFYPLYGSGSLGNRISWNESWWLQNSSGQKSADTVVICKACPRS